MQDLNNQKTNTKSGRHKQRTNAMKIIYQLIFNDDFEEVVPIYFEENEIDRLSATYLNEILDIFKQNKSEVDDILENSLHENWNIKRLSKIDLAILRVAIIEMQFLKAPYKVVINEAVELAKEYSDEESYGFVNGVLKTYLQKYQGEQSDEA
ncbi:transcription antitermination factor NusB [Criibacterium bergeronii]|uniref:Transcription antitermination protein NusB n=1 Tax=Criibacterium bergeronii TaxID=1871336 RepID=A0A1C0AGH5_9FIRM|nr:transcription antitermination factor NusB [Criibacterium bergeronii]MBS6064088.1 transcription antitermination factor NusB [Peptostreptococcaceae bacterium]RDY22044.1 transcription antitermination factor NusB [Criibacterium bergeronii]TRW26202.1 transcription antitermination factor NusB [Criibacterium bergeronii]